MGGLLFDNRTLYESFRLGGWERKNSAKWRQKVRDIIVAGKDCENCFYKQQEGDKILCNLRKKVYYYGQYIPCKGAENAPSGLKNKSVSSE